MGSYGDVLPLVAIGKEFVKCGHIVYLMTNGNFQSLAEDNGFNFLALGTQEEYLETIDSVDVHNSFDLGSKLLEFLVLAPIDEMIAHMKSIAMEDLLIVSYPGNIGIKAYAERYNIPFVSTVFAPILFESTLQPSRLSRFHILERLPNFLLRAFYFLSHKAIDLILVSKINEIRSQFDLHPITSTYSWILSSELVLGLFHEEFSTNPKDWPPQIELTGFALACIESNESSDELNLFIENHQHVILFTQGTPNAKVLPFFQIVQKVCDKLNIAAIFLSQFQEQLESFHSENIFVTKSLDLSDILPKLDGVVHHGGIGTTAQSLNAGIPQIIVPWGVDQFDNAKHLCRMGVAYKVYHGRGFQHRLQSTLQRLLTNSTMKETALLYSTKNEMYDGASNSYNILIEFFNKKLVCKLD